MSNFIESIIEEDLKNGTYKEVIVRFPPEPNGYLHLGHVKSIILNSYLAEKYNGKINLRFDDTNPEKETDEYVNSIKNDVFWLTNKIDNIFWASDYFDTIYSCAVHLIKNGLAYVDDDSIDDIKNKRGDFNKLGINSSYRTRTIDENLSLFEKMRNGEFSNGEKVLRAKIDMASSNMNMRDPVLYRIKHTSHHNTGAKWCIYPMYDFAHPISDAIEGITHSICTMEFEDHRPLYDWTVEHCKTILINSPKQIEFARLEMEGVMLSKRKLNNLVVENKVSGWNDTKMPTISGMRNKGFTPEILKEFILRSGFSKANSLIEKFTLEDCVRERLNNTASRTMAIINPVHLYIDNFSEIKDNIITCPNHPKDEIFGNRALHLSENLWVELDDIKTEATDNFWRIYPGNWVRLKHGYNILIKEVITDSNNHIVKVIAEADPESKIMKLAKHKAKVAIHWLSHLDSIDMKANFYNDLCDTDGNYLEDCLEVKNIKVEHYLLNKKNTHYEFERNGYFYVNDNIIHHLAPLKK